ncbi:MAG: hemerythrin domain-containing protein [Rhodocyclaceae bacterium]|nr:hemerythrin domain-containing protein [Rhodocyclaceae bacterium]
MNAALAILHDEHRSFAAIVHGLHYLLREMREKGSAPDFKLLWAMVYYLEAFPEKIHHPKEDVYLFARLRSRTHEADALLDELERQHLDGSRQVRELEHALGCYEAGKPNGLELFAAAVEKFADSTRQHVAVEEKIVIPLAKKHLTPVDWVEIAEAFGENGDPRFGVAFDHEFRSLFSRIVNLAPPPIGVGPSN